jgi:hypothetical protein
MDSAKYFNKYINQTFAEHEFYELLLFELEENFNQLGQLNLHFYFNRVENNKIQITEIVEFADGAARNQTARSIIEKKEWLELCRLTSTYNLLLCRFDRTGWLSIISENKTHTQFWKHGWLDELGPREPMTPDQMRQAFRELAGMLEDHQEFEQSRSKKAV